jgi:hypothetical protein
VLNAHVTSAYGSQRRQKSTLSNGPDSCSELKQLTFSANDNELFYTHRSILLATHTHRILLRVHSQRPEEALNLLVTDEHY